MLGLEWTLCGRLNQRRSLAVGNVQGRRRRAWLTRGRASSGEIGGREVDVMSDTGCEGVVVRKQLVDASQLTGECCLLLGKDNTALLAEKAVISLRTPFLSGEVKALCIPDTICDVIVGNVEGARSLEDPKMSVMVAHNSITGAHLGIRRTKDKVLSNFYWPGVDGDVTRYCRSCDVCQRTVKKGTVPRVPLEKVPLIDTPFKRVAIDLVGPINTPSEAGHRFILTLVDYATRFAEAVPLRKITTESVAEVLIDIYSRLGVPEEVLSDQETQFISDCMKEVCRLLGIKQKTTTPYHPMCNGLVERFNATLKTCLRRLCSEQPRQWHRYINPLLFAYREVPQEFTHFAPFKLLYGRTVRGPMHILRELWTKEIEGPDVKSTYEYDLNLRERLDDTLKIAREHFNDSDCEALPELGGWGSKESVIDLKYGDGLTLDQRKQLEEVAVTYSSIFSDRPGTASTEEHCIELTSSIPVRQCPYPVPYAMRQTLRE
ncbi:gypsy retrotransposon integrase-like protein 1 [Plakobranchus ocellatus]|uniref:Gypsy retrotransposon integrase-like protein 1 n=1 Tax=Plakobranchus ocellatus TaxID=259542 RepID=A0AAV3ZQP3_9GAST|nr:gypsy retrotransposon integrase-like protein 1 [Plakobranchus ocellatus]